MAMDARKNTLLMTAVITTDMSRNVELALEVVANALVLAVNVLVLAANVLVLEVAADVLALGDHLKTLQKKVVRVLLKHQSKLMRNTKAMYSKQSRIISTMG